MSYGDDWFFMSPDGSCIQYADQGYWVNNLNASPEHKEHLQKNNLPIKDEFVLMQYTGLRDKNGKEIYEGDKVKRRIMQDGMDWIDITCDVRWGKWCYCLYILDKYITCLDTPVANGCEVIGNIYETPELLK